MPAVTGQVRELLSWQKIAPFLDRALDLDAHERKRWLAEITMDQPDIAESLRQLLEDYDELNQRRFLSGSAVATEHETGFEEWLQLSASKEASDVVSVIRQVLRGRGEPAAGLAAGSIVGPYRLIREIGQGGMSSVWLAERCDGQLQREVALKLPFEGPRRAQLAERFKRECDILATLTHPNIARLYDAGVSASGQPYLAMEYVRGLALTNYCDEARLSIRERLGIFQQVTAAVEFAHSQLVLHRDLKPSNMLVTAEGRVVLLDFGIAKLLSPTEMPDAPLTEMAGRMFTPDYASPEHIDGKPLGTPSDVYSLGVLLYELLVGRRPFVSHHGSRRDLETAILTEDPVPPSQAPIASTAAEARHSTVRRIWQEIEGDLDAVVLKALARHPADRYLSGGALAQDIANHLDNLPVTAQPPRPWYRFRRFVVRHRTHVSAAAVALLAIVVGAATATWQAQAAGQERNRAVALASRNAAINEFLSMLITDAAASNKPVTVKQILDRSERLAQADTSGSEEDRAAVLSVIAAQYHALGDTDRAADLLSRALLLLHDTKDLGYRSQLVCAHAVAKATLRSIESAAVTIDRELATRIDPENAAYCLMYRAYLAQDSGDAEGTLRFAQQGLEQYYAGPKTSAADEGLLLGVVGRGYQLNGRNADADRSYRLAMQKYAALGRDGTPNAISVRNNWALVSMAAGVPKQALEKFDDILRALAERDPESQPPSYVLTNRARALEQAGRYQEARSLFAAGLEVSRQQNSIDWQLRCLIGLTSTSVALHDGRAAAGYIQEMSVTLQREGIDSGPTFQAVEVAAGKYALEVGNVDAAGAHFSRAVEQKGGVGATRIAALLGQAEVALLLNNPAEAEGSARTALELSKSAQGESKYSCHTGLSWLMLGRALHARRDTARVESAFEAAIAHLSDTVDPDHPELRRARELLAGTI
jgi:serine/threonine-protein kinase